MASRSRKKEIGAYALLIPYAVLLVLFFVGLSTCIMQSLGYLPAYGMETLTLDYYKQVFGQTTLVASIQSSFYIAVTSSVIAIVLGTLLSWCLVTLCKGRGILVSISRFPILVPAAASALFVIQVFGSTGLLARLLTFVGLDGVADLFDNVLYMPNSFGVILPYSWKEVPFCCYMVMATMVGISGSLGEAAMTLGASHWRSFRKVVLPHCVPAIRNAFMIVFAVAFGAYETPYLLGATLPKALPVLAYEEFRNSDFVLHRPYSMAINTIMFLISIAIALICYFSIEHVMKRNGLARHGS